jgi:hypothetical protein
VEPKSAVQPPSRTTGVGQPEPKRPAVRSADSRPVKAAPAPSARDEGREVLSAVEFPTVVVESVRWHPSADRRVARMHVDLAGPLDVREGDMIAGVLIEKIRPGAVQIRVGGRTRIFPIAP